MPAKAKGSAIQSALITAGIYAFVGGLWIKYSDEALQVIFNNDPDLISRFQTYKGWFFIFVTAVLVFFMVHRQIRNMRHLTSDLERIVDQRSSDLKQVNEQLANVNIDLEHRVEKRTAELESANQDLVDQMVQRESIERDLRESEQRFRVFANASFEGIIITEDGQFIDANQTFHDLLGYSRQEMIGKNVEYFVAPYDRDRVLKHIKERYSKPYQHDAIRKDGATINIEVCGANITYQGRECRITAMKDITEQKTLENQLRQAQQLEAIGRLAGGVAHDFNNLLMPILHFTSYGLEQLDDNKPLAKRLKIANQAAEQAKRLTSHLLTLGRKQMIELEPIDLNLLIDDTSQMLSKMVRGDVEIHFKLTDNLAIVEADQTQIQQILLNLAVNASDAMPKGGQIVITTSNAELPGPSNDIPADVEPGQYVLLSVSDNGIGMDRQTVSHIFEPFFTTKQRTSGTGLGLSTVYAIVKQHHGHITCQSEPGAGTTFHIYLKQTDAIPDIILEQTDDEFFASNNESVIVVEDDRHVREIICDIMNNAGYQVTACDDPKQAIEHIKQQPQTNIMISDIIMPNLNGCELYQQASRYSKQLKVLFVTGYSDDHVECPGKSKAAIPLLKKPFTSTQLLSKVREILDS